MDTTIFALKRAHHATLAFARSMVREFGITPARYELLRAIRTFDGDAIEQVNLVEILGVSASVVSRMIKALVGLGLVDHYRCEEYWRVKVVELTKDGIALLARIERSVFEWGFPDFALRLALDPYDRRRPPPRRTALGGLLRRVRDWFGDRARGDPYDVDVFFAAHFPAEQTRSPAT